MKKLFKNIRFAFFLALAVTPCLYSMDIDDKKLAPNSTDDQPNNKKRRRSNSDTTGSQGEYKKQKPLPTSSQKKQFKCLYCNSVLSSRSNLNSHKRKKHADKYLFTCNTCKVGFMSEDKLKKHAPDGKCSHKCPHCNYAPKQKNKIKSHIQKQHPDHCNFTCNTCKSGFMSKKQLDKHAPDGQCSHQCPHCSYAPKQKEKLKRHIQNNHSDLFNFPCETCRSGFMSKDELNQHAPDGQCSHQCPHRDCDYAPKEKTSLKKHIKTKHPDLLNFTCKTCKSGFTSKKQLDKHAPDGKCSHKCPDCAYAPNTKGNLTTHIQRQHPEHCEFTCNTCKSGFTSKKQLDKHAPDGQCSHKCPHCDYAPNTKGSLKRHIRNKHPKLYAGKLSITTLAGTSPGGKRKNTSADDRLTKKAKTVFGSARPAGKHTGLDAVHINPKYLGKTGVRQTIGHSNGCDHSWLSQPSFSFTKVRDLHTQEIKSQFTITNKSARFTYLSNEEGLTLEKLQNNTHERLTFVLAGRGTNAVIPNEQDGGRVVLIVPHDCQHVEKLVKENTDVLVVHHLYNKRNAKSLKLPTARRLAGFVCAQILNRTHFVHLDDNLERWFVGDNSITNYAQFYQALRTYAQQNNINLLSTKNYNPINHKNRPANELRAKKGTLGYKFFMFNLDPNNYNPLDLLPALFDIWGGDIYMQQAFIESGFTIAAVSSSSTLYDRSKRDEHIALAAFKTLHPKNKGNCAQPWLEQPAQGWENLSMNPKISARVIAKMKNMYHHSCAKIESDNKYIAHADLGGIAPMDVDPLKVQITTRPSTASKNHKKSRKKGRHFQTHSNVGTLENRFAPLIENGLQWLKEDAPKTHLYHHQKKALVKLYKKIRDERITSGYFDIATGAGKSFIQILHAILWHKHAPLSRNQNTIILVPTQDLVTQFGQSFISFIDTYAEQLGIDAKKVKQSVILMSSIHTIQQAVAINNGVAKGNKIIIGCTDSLSNMLESDSNKINLFDTFIVDELHMAPTALLKHLSKYTSQSSALLLGFSATPGKKSRYFGTQAIYSLARDTGVRRGYLAAWKVHRGKKFPKTEDRKRKKIAYLLKQKPNGAKIIDTNTMIYVSSIESANNLYQYLQNTLSDDNMHKIALYHSGIEDAAKQNPNTLRCFKDPKHPLKVLIAVQMGGVGLDADIANVIFMDELNPENTDNAAFHQKVGRALRGGRKKTRALCWSKKTAHIIGYPETIDPKFKNYRGGETTESYSSDGFSETDYASNNSDSGSHSDSYESDSGSGRHAGPSEPKAPSYDESRVRQITVTQQRGLSCGYHCVANAHAISQNNGIVGEFLDNNDLQARVLSINHDDTRTQNMANDNTILQYAETVGLNNVYMLGQQNGIFSINGYIENNEITDTAQIRHYLDDANFDSAAQNGNLQQILNLDGPLDNLRRQIRENGSGMIHFIVQISAHYVLVTVAQHADQPPSIYYADSLNSPLETNYSAQAAINYIQQGVNPVQQR